MKVFNLFLMVIVLSWLNVLGQSSKSGFDNPLNFREEINRHIKKPVAPIVVSGTHSYMCGEQDGTFPVWKKWIRDMNGIWAPPIKLLDGIYFQINSAPGKSRSSFLR